MSFQIHALSYSDFAPLFAMSDEELKSWNAVRQTVTETPGTPCRVSLRDAEPGETVILVNHVSLPESSPYRASHAIFVREGASQAHPDIGEVPEQLASRLLSVRGFDVDHMMIEADVVQGVELSSVLTRFFRDDNVECIHVHNARPGCFAARVTRA